MIQAPTPTFNPQLTLSLSSLPLHNQIQKQNACHFYWVSKPVSLNQDRIISLLLNILCLASVVCFSFCPAKPGYSCLYFYM